MASTLTKNVTKTGIESDGVTIHKETDIEGKVTISISTGYTVMTSEGETIRRDRNGRELTGAERTRAPGGSAM